MHLISFATEVHNFLIDQGYKYILYKGIRNTPKHQKPEPDNYILIPRKYLSPAQLQNPTYKIQKITSPDILQLLEPNPTIEYWIKLQKRIIVRFLDQHDLED